MKISVKCTNFEGIQVSVLTDDGTSIVESISPEQLQQLAEDCNKAIRDRGPLIRGSRLAETSVLVERTNSYMRAAGIAQYITEQTDAMEYANGIGAGLDSKQNGVVHLYFETQELCDKCPIKDEFDGIPIISQVIGRIEPLSAWKSVQSLTNQFGKQIIPAGCDKCLHEGLKSPRTRSVTEGGDQKK